MICTKRIELMPWYRVLWAYVIKICCSSILTAGCSAVLSVAIRFKIGRPVMNLCNR
jgi:hypothetical protein